MFLGFIFGHFFVDGVPNIGAEAEVRIDTRYGIVIDYIGATLFKNASPSSEL
jgi:hypothetical protein